MKNRLISAFSFLRYVLVYKADYLFMRWALDMSENKTEKTGDRSKDRAVEDEQSHSVIIKRIDQHRAHPDDILNFAIEEGLEQIQRRWLSLFVSAVAAGLILGLAAMAVAKMQMLGIENELSSFAQKLSVALVYPLGFIVCILSGTQLYTEHTATAVYPFLDKKASLGSLLRMLGLVAIGNLIGTFIGSIFIYLGNGVVKANQGYIELAMHQLKYTDSELIISALLAGWLMAQGAWLVLTTRADVEKIFLIFIATFIIGLCGLHHSIMGSAELFTGYLFDPSISIPHMVWVILIMLFGNLIGGSVFVALVNYAHIRQLKEE